MILVRTQLLQRLREEGLERIPVLGLPFDPEVSESVATLPVPDPDHNGVVVKDLMRGYRVNGRVVRHSRVVIGVYQEGAPPLAPMGAGQVVDNEPPAAASSKPEEPSLEEIVEQVEAQAALSPGVLEPGAEDEDDEGEPS